MCHENTVSFKDHFTQIKKKPPSFIAYLLWYPSMQIILVLCAETLSVRFMPPPKNNGGDWSYVCGAQSLGKLHVTDSTTAYPSRNNVQQVIHRGRSRQV